MIATARSMSVAAPGQSPRLAFMTARLLCCVAISGCARRAPSGLPQVLALCIALPAVAFPPGRARAPSRRKARREWRALCHIRRSFSMCRLHSLCRAQNERLRFGELLAFPINFGKLGERAREIRIVRPEEWLLDRQRFPEGSFRLVQPAEIDVAARQIAEGRRVFNGSSSLVRRASATEFSASASAPARSPRAAR